MLNLGGFGAIKPFKNPINSNFMEEMECHYESSII